MFLPTLCLWFSEHPWRGHQRISPPLISFPFPNSKPLIYKGTMRLSSSAPIPQVCFFLYYITCVYAFFPLKSGVDCSFFLYGQVGAPSYNRTSEVDIEILGNDFTVIQVRHTGEERYRKFIIINDNVVKLVGKQHPAPSQSSTGFRLVN